MTPKEFNQRLQNTINGVESSLGNTMVKLGSTALTLMRQRVQETGINAEGNKYAPYSKKPMFANCKSMTTSACARIAGSKQKRKELKWVTLKRGGKNIKLFEIKGGYNEFRQLHGRQTDHTDFTFYGKMWGSMKIISNPAEHQSGIVTIGPSTDEEMKKLQGNVNRRGQILDLSNAEITQLTEIFKISTLRIIRDKGL